MSAIRRNHQFCPNNFNFDIPNHFCTKDERSKKSNYLEIYHRYAFWIFGSISPMKCPLSVGTTNLATRTLYFDVSNYSPCTTVERSKNSNNLKKYHRYAFWIFGIISPPQCQLSVETTNFAPTTLSFDISNYVYSNDKRRKKSNYLGKYRRYAVWIYGIISPPKCPLSAETTNLPQRRLISTNLIILGLRTSRVTNRIILGNIADTRFESSGLYHPWNVRYL